MRNLDENSVDYLPVLDDAFDDLMMMVMLADSPDGSAAQGGGQNNGGGSSSLNPSLHGGDSTKKKRKNIHRDVERQRRQEMASLYASLRSHLPLQLLKGKRSISDHIHEAIGYIKHLQNQIQGLNDLRNDQKSRLLKPTNLQKSINGDRTVMVNPCMGGVEVTIHTELIRDIPLSRVLGFLGKEGLTVIFWTSTRVKERVLYSIKSEVTDRGKNSDVCDLQRRLINILGLS